MSRARTFILGVGAQKAGTTWLHSYLNAYEGANFGVAKEYHIWDAAYCDLARGRRISLTEALFRRRDVFWHRYPSRELWVRYRMQRQPGFYERYFKRLTRGDIWLTGDITPGYAGLTPAQLASVKSRLEAQGFHVKAVFLMRDPVERCWSAVRHQHRINAAARVTGAYDCEMDHLRADLQKPSVVLRTRYSDTMAALDATFPSEDVYYGLYETMFEPAEVQRLSEFVAIPANPAMARDRVNASPKSKGIDPDVAAQIRATYADVYAYCARRLPRTQEVWG